MTNHNRRSITGVSKRASRTVNFVGGGIMGLAGAIELDRCAREFGLNLSIRVFEPARLGGGSSDMVAAPRSQLWVHRDGQLYASTQPGVTKALQRATRLLRRLVPRAFRDDVPAFSLEPPGDAPRLSEFFDALGVRYTSVSPSLLRVWWPKLRLPDGYRVYSVRDTCIDLPLLARALAHHCDQREVQLVRRGVVGLHTRRGEVSALDLEQDNVIKVDRNDIVVLTCGAGIRPLLSKAGLSVDGLRVFRSHIVADAEAGLGAILAVANGGVNCVPHRRTDGTLLNLFGDSMRKELSLQSDGAELPLDLEAVDGIRRQVRETFGLELSKDSIAWTGRKTEIFSTGSRSQAAHCRRVVNNLWIAVPGKLSAAAGCARDLAEELIRTIHGDEARPIWDVPEVDPQLPPEAALALVDTG